MAVLPTFDPQGSAAEAPQVFNATAETTSSIMARAQQSQRAEQELEMKRQQFEVQKPVMMAKAQADIATAGAQLATTKRLQDLRTQFASIAPQAMQEYLQVAQTAYKPAPVDEDGNPTGEGAPDWVSQYEGYQDLRAKYSQFDVLPEGKQMLDSFEKSGFYAHTNYLADMKMRTDQAIAEENRQAAIYRADVGAASRETVGAGHDLARVQGDQITAGSRMDVETSREAAFLQREQLRADLQAGKLGAIIDNLNNRADAAEQDAADSLAGHDTVGAQLALKHAQEYRDAALKERTFANGTPGKPQDVSNFVPRHARIRAPTPYGTLPEAHVNLGQTAVPTSVASTYPVGTTVIQKGVTYKWDGAKWEPVTTQ